MDAKKRVAAGLAVLLLAAAAYWGYRAYFAPAETAIQATGTIEATEVELQAKTPGTLEKITVEAGDTVTRGQLVAELSRSDLVAQREQNAMLVSKAEAQLADLLSGARAQELKEAAAAVDTARVDYEKAAADLERAKTLFAEGAISRSDLERAEVNMQAAQNRLRAAEARLSMLQAGSRPQQVNAARAELERARAMLAATEAVLEDLKIYSPIDGVVLSSNYQEGEFVQMGASLVTVADLDDLWIKVYIPTDDLPRVKLGDTVHFTVSGYDRVFTGVVEQIASRGEYTPKTIQTKKERANVVFAVKIGIDSAGSVLKPGMPADVVFDEN